MELIGCLSQNILGTIGNIKKPYGVESLTSLMWLGNSGRHHFCALWLLRKSVRVHQITQ